MVNIKEKINSVVLVSNLEEDKEIEEEKIEDEEIEDNVWLIGMEESSILITLKPSNTLFYYE